MTLLLTDSSSDRPIVDRRRTSRRQPSYLRFYSPVPGVIVDLSRHGMAVRASEVMEVGREIRFRVRHRSRLFTLTGVVRRCEIEPAPTGSDSQASAMALLAIEFVEELSIEGLTFMTSQAARRQT